MQGFKIAKKSTNYLKMASNGQKWKRQRLKMAKIAKIAQYALKILKSTKVVKMQDLTKSSARTWLDDIFVLSSA